MVIPDNSSRSFSFRSFQKPQPQQHLAAELVPFPCGPLVSVHLCQRVKLRNETEQNLQFRTFYKSSQYARQDSNLRLRSTIVYS